MKTIEQLEKENAELAAQVEALRRDKSDLLAYALDAEKWFNSHDPNGYVSPKRENAQHHLREVRAGAGRAGFVAGYLLCNDGSALIKHNYEGFADKYADKIRRGEVE